MLKIKKIDAFSLAKIMTIIYALLGFAVGLVVTVLTLLNVDIAAMTNSNLSFPLVGVAAVVILPFLYGILGFLTGILTGFFFNLAAKFVGGLEIETQ